MGSCSNKDLNQINSIKPVPVPHHEGKQTFDAEALKELIKVNEEDINNNHNRRNSPMNPEDKKIETHTIKEERKGRKSHKKLTVLSTNDDEIELNPEVSAELSLINKKSIGKKEQGSLLMVRNPVTFGGVISSPNQIEFEEKLMKIQGDDVKTDYLLEHELWVCCKKGLKPDVPNQDDYVIVIDEKSMILGVFDGHGTHGHEISNFIHQSFPMCLINNKHWLEDPKIAICEAFPKVQKELIEHCHKKTSQFDCILSGSTATIIIIRPQRLYIGHVGDSRAIIGKKIDNKIKAYDLTRDHKPRHSEEYQRIIRMGGEVIRAEEDAPYRVFVRGQNYPGIAMSRTIGDALAQTVGVVCIPEIREVKLSIEDEFLIICSDGVWEFITSQEAVEEVFKFRKNPKAAAQALSELAWRRWITYEKDVVDDITVMVVFLKNFIEFTL